MSSPLKVRPFKTHGRPIIFWLKRLLPMGVVLMMGVLFFWPKIDDWIHPKTPPKIRGADDKVALSNTLTDAKIHGTDDKGRPYTMTAKTARQITDDEATLDTPISEMTLDDGATVSLRANKGVYREKDKKIDYQGNVIFQSPHKGFKFTTPKASIDFSQGTAHGNSPLSGVTDHGTIQAEKGFSIEDKGNRLIFKGKAQLTLNPTK